MTPFLLKNKSLLIGCKQNQPVVFNFVILYNFIPSKQTPFKFTVSASTVAAATAWPFHTNVPVVFIKSAPTKIAVTKNTGKRGVRIKI